MNYLYAISDYVTWLIFLLAIFELLLYIFLFKVISRKMLQLRDSLFNLLRGVKNFPERNKLRNVYDEVRALINALKTIKEHQREYIEDKRTIIMNVNQQDSKKLSIKSFRIDSWSNVAAAIVQIFPLMGILGTVLAMGQSMQKKNSLLNPEISNLVSSFVNAVDTTILGLIFTVFFMIINAFFEAKTNDFYREIDQYQNTINSFRLI